MERNHVASGSGRGTIPTEVVDSHGTEPRCMSERVTMRVGCRPIVFLQYYNRTGSQWAVSFLEHPGQWEWVKMATHIH